MQAGLQIAGVVLAGNEDGHQRRLLRQRPLHMAGAGEFAPLHRAAAPGGRQMIRHCPLRRLLHIGLGRRAAAGGRRVDPPVVQHLREMPGLRRRVTPLHFIDQTQEKVVILCAVTFRALTAHRVKQ